MALTNYPNGLSSFGIPLIGSGPILTTGNIYFVSSVTGSNGNDGLSPSRPWSTVDYAVGRCTANQGDHVIVMPNHAETSTNTAGYWAFDVAGLTFIGIGSAKQRPRLLLDAGTASTVTISAADVTLRNFEFSAGTASVVRAINLTSSGAWLDQIEFNDNAASENFLVAIDGTSTTDENAANLKVTSSRFITADAGATEFIVALADITGLVATDNLFVSEGTATFFIRCATGKDLKQCQVLRNYMSHKSTAGNLFISNDTASANNSGVIAHNRVGHADVTGAHAMGAVGGCRFFDNLSVSTDALSGLLLPAADVDL